MNLHRWDQALASFAGTFIIVLQWTLPSAGIPGPLWPGLSLEWLLGHGRGCTRQRGRPGILTTVALLHQSELCGVWALQEDWVAGSNSYWH
jgi:hypothetical protein